MHSYRSDNNIVMSLKSPSFHDDNNNDNNRINFCTEEHTIVFDYPKKGSDTTDQSSSATSSHPELSSPNKNNGLHSNTEIIPDDKILTADNNHMEDIQDSSMTEPNSERQQQRSSQLMLSNSELRHFDISSHGSFSSNHFDDEELLAILSGSIQSLHSLKKGYRNMDVPADLIDAGSSIGVSVADHSTNNSISKDGNVPKNRLAKCWNQIKKASASSISTKPMFAVFYLTAVIVCVVVIIGLYRLASTQQTRYYQNEFQGMAIIVTNHILYNFQNTIYSMSDINQVVTKMIDDGMMNNGIPQINQTTKMLTISFGTSNTTGFFAVYGGHNISNSSSNETITHTPSVTQRNMTNDSSVSDVNNNGQWPLSFITIPNFGNMVRNTIQRSSQTVVMMSYHPLIHIPNVDDPSSTSYTEYLLWEEYVNQYYEKWINESFLDSSSNTMKYFDRSYHQTDYPAYPTIWNFTTGQPIRLETLRKNQTHNNSDNEDYYYALPMWQSSPLSPLNQHFDPPPQWENVKSSSLPLYNQDSFLFLSQPMIQDLVKNDKVREDQLSGDGQFLLSKIANYDKEGDDVSNLYSDWVQSYLTDTIDAPKNRPFSFIYYPIYVPDSVTTSYGVNGSNTSTNTTDNYTNAFHQASDVTLNGSIVSEQTNDLMTNDSKATRYRMIGILSGAFLWDEHFQGIFRSSSIGSGEQNNQMNVVDITEQQDENLRTAGTNTSSYMEAEGLIVIIENSCREAVSYRINGPMCSFIGQGDLHDSNYDEYKVSIVLNEFLNQRLKPNFQIQSTGNKSNDIDCSVYTISMYPSKETIQQFNDSNNPMIAIIVITMVLLILLLAFGFFYLWMEHRHQIVSQQAIKSSAIVSSLFPSIVRDRLLTGLPNNAAASLTPNHSMHGGENLYGNHHLQPTKLRLKSFLHTGEDCGSLGGNNGINVPDPNGFNTTRNLNNVPPSLSSKPIADLFLDCTVMFADIAGFTAWCSVREPTQVFVLLESVYLAFDKLASRRNIFKVETIGDSYVAVTGLPEPRADHAVAMVKFARDCRTAMAATCYSLEKTLGPDTGDLQSRFGLNSGPVTAGVLRSIKGRFQLFGDTVNTASRMESCGMKSKIHVSQATADCLVSAGLGHWITKRNDLIEVKGKGPMQTYWVEPTAASKVRKSISHTRPDSQVSKTKKPDANKNDRLVDWVVDVMDGLIRKIIVRRKSMQHKWRNIGIVTDAEFFTLASSVGKNVLDEVREIVELPEFDEEAFRKQEDPDNIELGSEVKKQLRRYVLSIATMYNDNPFHNFEHAAHVTMSVTKLMSRIVAPDQFIEEGFLNAVEEEGQNRLASTLHDHTYGITSDPLTQFACVFSSLIHDVDHPGVPNSQLAKEDKILADVYRGKSIAEQNSIDLAWDLLTSSHFSELRKAICGTEPEMRHFRQLVINSVMATDIMDPDLKKLRNSRWDVAFKDGNKDDTPRDKINRKATIVIEHIIQASDVAHTMQHWHIYRKWNERFFEEMYLAYVNGRAEKDPSDFWYKGEIGFFDFYVIPLAKKLSECGVFGVSSDEYLNYAIRNRDEWERRGEEVVEQMVERVLKKLRTKITLNPSTNESQTRTSNTGNQSDSSESSCSVIEE